MASSIPDIVDRATDVIIEPSPKRVRVLFGGSFVADSMDARLLFERGHSPAYYFPREDVQIDALTASSKTYECPRKGHAQYWSIEIGDRQAPDAAWNYPEPKEGCPPIGDLIAFEWDAVDAWFEEDEEVFVHPRSPYKRIDVLESSRHVEVHVDGTTIAASDRAVVLFETGLQPRYYLPKTDVSLEYLLPSQTETRCPYKGIANRYWNVDTGDETIEDAAWSYDHPTTEAARIAGRIAFYSERVEVTVNGRRVE